MRRLALSCTIALLSFGVMHAQNANLGTSGAHVPEDPRRSAGRIPRRRLHIVRR